MMATTASSGIASMLEFEPLESTGDVVVDHAESVEILQALLPALDGVRPVDYANSKDPEHLRARIVAPLSSLLADALTYVEALERSYESKAPDRGDFEMEDDSDFTFSGPSPAQMVAMEADAGDDANRRAADTCFTVAGELRRIGAQLRSPGRAPREILITGDRAGRKLRRAIFVVLEVVAEVEGRSLPALAGRRRDFEVAMAVRALYSRFWASLCEYDEEDPESVRRAIRQTAVALAVMAGSDEFADVRLCDRMTLLDLQARVFAWVRDPARREGVQLLKDIHTTADLLRAVNMRQELQVHDARVLPVVREIVDRALDDPDARPELVAQLTPLRGRDPELDAILRRLRKQARGALDGDALSHLRCVVGRLSAGLSAQPAASGW